VSHKLRMSAEISDWLTDLCADDAATATEVGAALMTLLEAPDLPGPALVTDPALHPPPSPAQQAAALEAAQQSLQWALRLARTAATEGATDVRRAAHDVRELEQQPGHDRAELAARRRRLAGARLFEQKATEHSDRSEREVDAFRVRAEAARARYDTAVTARDLHADVAAEQAAASNADDTAAAAEGISRAALHHLQVLLAEAPRLVRRISDGASTTALAADEPDQPATETPAHSAAPGAPSLAQGLLELRADPLGGDIRLLFAMEPAATVTVLAVLEGEGAVRVHRDKALGLASDLLAEIRSGDWPPAQATSTADTELTLEDAAAFLDRFFAQSAAGVRRRAAARSNANTLTELRQQRGVSIQDLAEATGITQERLSFIEEGGLRVAQVREAVACIRALGGHVDLSADLDGQTRFLF
jgi:Helix-turn-helix